MVYEQPKRHKSCSHNINLCIFNMACELENDCNSSICVFPVISYYQDCPRTQTTKPPFNSESGDDVYSTDVVILS